MATATQAERSLASKFAIKANALLFAVLVLVGLLLVNYISAHVYGRKDLTEDNLYTLSEASRKLVSNLPRTLTVKLFVSENLLPGYRETAQYIKDLLDEYENASNGRFKWMVIHPEYKDEYKKEAERYGIKPFVARAKTATALEAKTITFGLVISYTKPGGKDEVEVLPVLQPGIERNIEYLITERIRRLTVRRKKILVLTGHGQVPFQVRSRFQDYLQQLFRQYEVQTYTLKGKSNLPDDADILLVMTPKNPYTREEIEKIDRWLMKGKAAMFLLDGVIQQRQQMMPNNRMPPIFMGAKSGLEDLLKTWGVSVNQDVVMDHQLQLFPAGNQVLFHPAIPAVRVPGLKGMVTVVIGSSLWVEKAYLGKKSSADFHILPILRTTDKAWTKKPPFLFNVRAKPRPPAGEKLKAYLLGVAIEGRIPSLGAAEDSKKESPRTGDKDSQAKEAPEKQGDRAGKKEQDKGDDKGAKKEARPAGKAEAEKGAADKETTPRKKSAKRVRIVVIGDSDILRFAGRFLPNRILMQNLMDWLAEDEALVKLRNKIAQDRTLDLPEDRSAITGIKLGTTLGLPLIVVLAGFGLWGLRRRARRAARI